MSSRPYVVRSGEYLTGIAASFGTTVAAILRDDANAGLRTSRSNPEILAPGDVVYIPESRRKWLSVNVGGTNTFVATPIKVTLQVVLLGRDREPLSNKSVTLDPPSDTPLTTDSNGVLTYAIAITVKCVEVAVDGTNLRFRIRVGNLDPIDTDSGLASRLRHLGHGGDEEEHVLGRDWLSGSAAALRATALGKSIASFQRTNGQEADGEADDDLRGAVYDAHSC